MCEGKGTVIFKCYNIELFMSDMQIQGKDNG